MLLLLLGGAAAAGAAAWPAAGARPLPLSASTGLVLLAVVGGRLSGALVLLVVLLPAALLAAAELPEALAAAGAARAAAVLAPSPAAGFCPMTEAQEGFSGGPGGLLLALGAGWEVALDSAWLNAAVRVGRAAEPAAGLWSRGALAASVLVAAAGRPMDAAALVGLLDEAATWSRVWLLTSAEGLTVAVEEAAGPLRGGASCMQFDVPRWSVHSARCM
jgi:hypothetical protein